MLRKPVYIAIVHLIAVCMFIKYFLCENIITKMWKENKGIYRQLINMFKWVNTEI